MPLETGTASVFDTEPGYRIARRDYALPDIPLEPDEAAAVGIAARLWQHAGLAAAASSGLAKLRAAGVDVDPQATLGVEPIVTVDPAFAPLTAAARDRRTVAFDYRVPEQDGPTSRRLQPWGVVCWRGRWYVVGHDLDRGAARCFRLSRVVGAVRLTGRPGAYQPPADLDLISYVARFTGPGRAHRPGHRAGPPGPGRRAAPLGAGDGAGPEGDRLVLRYADVDCLAGRLVGYGADVRVLEPPEVREAVIQRLKEIAARHDGRRPRGCTSDRSARGAIGLSADRLARLLNLVPYLLARPGIEVAEAAGDLGRDRAAAARGPGAALGVRAARLRPGRPDRHGVRRRPGDDHLRRRHRPAAAADPRRGAGAGGGAADARRDARAWPTATRSSGRWPRSRTRPATSPTRRSRCGCRATTTGWPRCAARSSAAGRCGSPTTRPTRDETTERVIDPIRLLMVEGRAYVEAWCRRAEAVRLFRADRIDALAELDEPAAPPPQAELHDLSDGVFRPAPDLPLVTLRVGRGGRWITEYYPCEDVRRDRRDPTSGWSRCG